MQHSAQVIAFPMDEMTCLIRETALLLEIRKEENRRKYLWRTTINRLSWTLQAQGLSTEEIQNKLEGFAEAVRGRLIDLAFARDVAAANNSETDIIDFEATKYCWELHAS